MHIRRQDGMREAFYDMIFKRKSFHLFRGVGPAGITEEILQEIKDAWTGFVPLYPEIRTALRIIPANKVMLKRDAEYCLLLYSEKKDNYLLNAGYLGEQLDLWLTEHHIGSLWYGIGKPDEPAYDGLDYVIMFAVHKADDDSQYRKDMFKAKRKALPEVWSGESLGRTAEIARFAPSACNSQPWFAAYENGMLTVSRIRKSGKIGIMTPSAAKYYNRIDMGIYLLFLELCLEKEGYRFERTLFPDDGEAECAKTAEYRIDESVR